MVRIPRRWVGPVSALPMSHLTQLSGRFLRILATNHIYRELEPNVFTNNRISSMMDTLKPTKDLFAESAP